MTRPREEIEAARVLASEWDTLDDLRPILRDALLSAFEAGRLRQQVTRPSPLECTAPYLHQTELTHRQKCCWADIVLRAGEALKSGRQFYMGRPDQEAVIAVEALLHRCLPKPGAAEPVRERSRA